MEPFIRNEQFNFIKIQTQKLINGHSTVNDKGVLNALESLALEAVLNLFEELNAEQKQLLAPIVGIKDRDQAEEFLSQLKPYVIPFKVTQQSVKKVLSKAKKLKVPPLEKMDLTELSYLGWDDKGSQKKFLVAYHGEKLVGLQGTFSPLNKKGICAICNKLEPVGMFMTETKGAVQGTFTKRGNYICEDSQKCNQNITSLEKLNDFIARG
ncbi:FusB/FusC family EF-G-binding protein [Bacillus massilinigeriensis]|uniref:FusB/FusC family EF-G-binding protein n=1 Tax=Bacillus massilionigeriensis TaxID=1805475 RepID=UPI00096B403B|nr:FusB/FusC family EF-G-binding protein [Bacillus massilionigeriensis]